MSIFSDISEAYAYHRKLSIYQHEVSAHQIALAKIGDSDDFNGLQVQQKQLEYQKEHAQNFPVAPTAPEKSGFWNHVCAGIWHTSLSSEQQTQNQSTHELFSNTTQAIDARDSALRANQQALDAAVTQKAHTDSAKSGIVPNASPDVIEKHGLASKQHSVPYVNAVKYAEHAHGCLYVEPHDDGLTGVLRPTLPEVATINNQSLKLREAHNRFMRGLARAHVDSSGNVRKSRFTADLLAAVDQCLPDPTKPPPPDIESKLRAPMAAFVEKYFKDNLSPEGDLDVEAQMAQITDYLCLVRAPSGRPALCATDEALTAWSSAADSIVSASMLPQEDYIKTVEVELRHKYGDNEVELQKQIDQNRAVVSQLYGEINDARQAMVDMCNLDVTTKDTPLPNACSANGAFMQGVLYSTQPDAHLESLRYETKSYIATHPVEGLDAMRAYKDTLDLTDEQIKTLSDALNLTTAKEVAAQRAVAEAEKTAQEAREKATSQEATAVEIAAQEEANAKVASAKAELKTAQYDKAVALENFSRPLIEHNITKYEYHVAGHVGDIENTAITVEAFAAETSQFMVSPATQKAAVGIYAEGEQGMTAYYNQDNPIPDENVALSVAHNSRIKKLTYRTPDSTCAAYNLKMTHYDQLYGEMLVDHLVTRFASASQEISRKRAAAETAKSVVHLQGVSLGEMDELAPLIMLTKAPANLSEQQATQFLQNENLERVSVLASYNMLLQKSKDGALSPEDNRALKATHERVVSYAAPVFQALEGCSSGEADMNNMQWLENTDSSVLATAYMAAPLLSGLINQKKYGALTANLFHTPEELQKLSNKAEAINATQTMVRADIAPPEALGWVGRLAFPGEKCNSDPASRVVNHGVFTNQLNAQVAATKKRFGNNPSCQSIQANLDRATASSTSMSFSDLQHECRPAMNANTAPAPSPAMKPHTPTKSGPKK